MGLVKLIFFSLAAAYHQSRIEKARDKICALQTRMAFMDEIEKWEQCREKHWAKKAKLDSKIEKLKSS